MRVLGIETSSRRGSVAVVEAGRVVCAREYVTENAHGEKLQGTVEEVFAAAGWKRSSLDRVAVGIGPGSFTGLRVGIAFAQGVALGLGRPIVGVCSLRAMALAVPRSVPGYRAPLLDARRSEWFAALYDVSGHERLSPCVVPKPERLSELAGVPPLAGVLPGEWVAVGEVIGGLDGVPTFRSSDSDLPHATYTALWGAGEDVGEGAAEPLYIRPVDAIRPNLPPSPLSSGTPSP